MARPRKYGSEEERRQAHAESQAAYRRRQAEGRVPVSTQAVEELFAAIDVAAATGNPVARQCRTGTPDALLRNLAHWFRQAGTPAQGDEVEEALAELRAAIHTAAPFDLEARRLDALETPALLRALAGRFG